MNLLLVLALASAVLAASEAGLVKRDTRLAARSAPEFNIGEGPFGGEIIFASMLSGLLRSGLIFSRSVKFS